MNKTAVNKNELTNWIIAIGTIGLFLIGIYTCNQSHNDENTIFDGKVEIQGIIVNNENKIIEKINSVFLEHDIKKKDNNLTSGSFIIKDAKIPSDNNIKLIIDIDHKTYSKHVNLKEASYDKEDKIVSLGLIQISTQKELNVKPVTRKTNYNNEENLPEVIVEKKEHDSNDKLSSKYEDIISKNRTKAYVLTDKGGPLFLRKEPSKKSNLITSIPNKSDLEIIEYENELVIVDGKKGRWCIVKYKEYIGYAFGGYLKKK